jgi:predicted ATPase
MTVYSKLLINSSGSRAPELHLKIGVTFDQFHNDEDHLFDIVNHYFLGLSKVTAPEEIARIRQLNIKAGFKAKKANATGSAIKHFSSALEYTPKDAWDKDNANTLILYKELAEVYYLDGQLEKSEALIQECLEKAINPIDRSDIYYVWMLRLTLESNMMKHWMLR